MVSQTPTEYGLRPNTLTILELEQSMAAVLNTLASVHSRRSYTFAIDRFIAWYCSEARLTFNRAVVVRYRSHLEGLRPIMQGWQFLRPDYLPTPTLHTSSTQQLLDREELGVSTTALGIPRGESIRFHSRPRTDPRHREIRTEAACNPSANFFGFLGWEHSAKSVYIIRRKQ